MSGINSVIKITDGMSPALRSMNKALNIVLNNFEKLQSVSGNSIDTAEIQNAREELTNASVAIIKMEEEIKSAGEQQERLTNKIEKSSDVMGGLVKKAAALVGTYASMQTLDKLVNLSDQNTQTEARLKLVVDTDANETLESLTQDIFASANRSRALYADSADIVASLAQRAGDAFNGNDEVITFTETLNKMYVIAGASAEEQKSSMQQLTQALGSGVLRGEEFNAVFEAAPNIMQEVADYMGIPIGELRNMAAEGLITAEVVKSAIIGAAESVNDTFNSMPMTWKQVMNKVKNYGLKALNPVLSKINEVANNEKVQTFAVEAVVAMGNASMVMLDIFNIMATIATFAYENWSWISPIIGTAGAALATYYGIVLALKTAELLGAGAKLAMAVASHAVAGAMGTQVSATAAAMVAQYGFNSAILASPLLWLLVTVIAIIGAMSILANVITTTSGVFISGWGLILATIYTAGALIWNVVVGLYNLITDLIVSLLNVLIGTAEYFANIWTDPLGTIARVWVDWANLILGIIKSIANAIDAIFGSELASSVQGWMDSLDSIVTEKFGDGMFQFERFAGEDTYLQRIKYEDTTAYGIDSGNTISDWIGDKFNLFGGMDDIYGNLGLDGLLDNTYTGTETDSYLSNIADNTGAMADSMEVTDEDLKYLRDLAEQEAVNRFTTAEIKIDMQNHNSISSDVDIDGIVTQLEDRLYESMEIAAEGVH
ncbi:MAG: phage tail tape measure protein [Lachnospiraceae bacterium]|nr:phage tail tape measure protein [Lachnospiraceae bacterium]